MMKGIRVFIGQRFTGSNLVVQGQKPSGLRGLRIGDQIGFSSSSRLCSVFRAHSFLAGIATVLAEKPKPEFCDIGMINFIE